MFNMNKKNTLLDDILIDLPAITDNRGSLTFVENTLFDYKRAFWIYNVPEDSERGGHAHRTCSELLVAVHGSFDLELNDGQQSITMRLDNPHKAVLIRPMVWCRLSNFSKDFVGLCLASQEYRPEGYIHSFEEFLAQ